MKKRAGKHHFYQLGLIDGTRNMPPKFGRARRAQWPSWACAAYDLGYTHGHGQFRIANCKGHELLENIHRSDTAICVHCQVRLYRRRAA